MKRTDKLNGTFVIAALVVGSTACDGLEVPQNPTWAEHVKPILAAKCVHCHGYPAIQGAPNTFRLDVYENTQTADGRTIFGAAQMAPSIQTRIDHAALDGFGNKPYSIDPMPPDPASLSDEQKKILFNWANAQNWENGRPRRGAVPGNRPPRIELTQPLADSVDGDLVTVHYELRDPDGEAVAGQLRVGDTMVDSVRIGSVELGPGQVVWDTGQFPLGTHRLFAVVEDGSGSHEIDVASFDVDRADANVAPRIYFVTPTVDSVVGDEVQPLAIGVGVSDPDAGDSFTLSVRAVTDGVFVRVADDEAAVIGINSFTWNTASDEFPEGTWRLEATVSDGTVTRTRVSQPFIVSHAPPMVTFDQVSRLFIKCATCHGGSGLPGPEFDPLSRGMLGRVYQRVVLQRNMPPESYRTFDDGPDDPQLTQAERDMIGQWILSGAPGVP